MKFKKSSLKSLFLIVFIISILFLTGTFAVVIDEKVKVDTAIKYDNKVKTNNSFFELQWDFDVTGYGADGRFYLKSSDFKSLDKNRTVYIGLITPSLINNNNDVSITQSENIKNVVTKSFFCDTNKYGWEVFNQEIWCNSTFSKINNITFINESSDTKNLYSVTLENNLIASQNNLSVTYNITTFSKQNIKTDLSVSFINIEQKDIKTYLKKINKDFTDLGNNWALINIPINLTQNQVNILELKLDVPKNLLPLKYSVVIIDANDNSYIIIDPTIVNARTWSTNNDFTNGTILTNLTSSASGITLSAGSSLPQGDFFDENFTRGDSATVGNNWTETEIGGATVGISSNTMRADFGDSNDAEAIQAITMPTGTFYVNSSMKVNHVTVGSSAWWFRWDADASFSGGWGFTKYDGGGGIKIHNCTAWVDKATQVSDTYVNFYTVVYPSTRKYDLYIDGVLATANNSFCGSGTLTKVRYAMSNSGDDSTNFGSADFVRITENTTSPAKTTGTYSDRQGWSPQTGNQITNISITADNSSGGNIRFRYNSTNASLDTSDWTILANGTSTLTLNLGVNNNIFYQYDFNGTGTGLVSSYTINERQAPAVTSSCTYVSGAWTVQGSEKCGLNTTALGGQNIIFNGTGQIRILQSITGCGVVTLQNGVDVTVTSGARLC